MLNGVTKWLRHVCQWLYNHAPQAIIVAGSILILVVLAALVGSPL